MNCSYKNLFGSPGTGLHSYRLGGLAIVDVLLTILVAGLVSFYMEWPFWPTLGGLFLLGIALHWLFCVRTTVDKILFS